LSALAQASHAAVHAARMQGMRQGGGGRGAWCAAAGRPAMMMMMMMDDARQHVVAFRPAPPLDLAAARRPGVGGGMGVGE